MHQFSWFYKSLLYFFPYISAFEMLNYSCMTANCDRFSLSASIELSPLSLLLEPLIRQQVAQDTTYFSDQFCSSFRFPLFSGWVKTGILAGALLCLQLYSSSLWVCDWGSTHVGIVFCLQVHSADRTKSLTEDKMMRKECNGKCPVLAFCRSNQNEEPSPPIQEIDDFQFI